MTVFCTIADVYPELVLAWLTAARSADVSVSTDQVAESIEWTFHGRVPTSAGAHNMSTTRLEITGYLSQLLLAREGDASTNALRELERYYTEFEGASSRLNAMRACSFLAFYQMRTESWCNGVSKLGLDAVRSVLQMVWSSNDALPEHEAAWDRLLREACKDESIRTVGDERATEQLLISARIATRRSTHAVAAHALSQIRDIRSTMMDKGLSDISIRAANSYLSDLSRAATFTPRELGAVQMPLLDKTFYVHAMAVIGNSRGCAVALSLSDLRRVCEFLTALVEGTLKTVTVGRLTSPAGASSAAATRYTTAAMQLAFGRTAFMSQSLAVDNDLADLGGYKEIMVQAVTASGNEALDADD